MGSHVCAGGRLEHEIGRNGSVCSGSVSFSLLACFLCVSNPSASTIPSTCDKYHILPPASLSRSSLRHSFSSITQPRSLHLFVYYSAFIHPFMLHILGIYSSRLTTAFHRLCLLQCVVLSVVCLSTLLGYCCRYTSSLTARLLKDTHVHTRLYCLSVAV